MLYGASQAGFLNGKEINNMKQQASLYLLLALLATGFSSCEIVGGIFKAGFWTAIVLVVLVVVLILWLVNRGRR